MARKIRTATPVDSDESREEGSEDVPEASYEVGYAKPPVHKQFKPGESGNPAGRPKRARNAKTIIRKVIFEEQIELPIGGRKKRMPNFEALVRTTLHRSLRGEPKALSSLMILLRLTGLDAEAADIGKDALQDVDLDGLLADYMARKGNRRDDPDEES